MEIAKLVKPAYAQKGTPISMAPPRLDPSLGEILTLNANENQWGVSPKALEAMQKALQTLNTYPDPDASALKALLASEYELTPAHFAVANGSSSILDVLGNLFICPGDEVIFCMPTFFIYETITLNNGGTPIALPLNSELCYDIAEIANHITSKTKMVFLCNPNNPTGTHIDADALEGMICSLPDSIITVVDEAYIEFADSATCRSMVSLIERKNVVVVRTFSKMGGLAGVRIGYAIAKPEIIGFMQNRILTFEANAVALAGACGYLQDKTYRETCRQGVIAGRNYLTRELSAFGWTVYPSQSNFLFVKPADIDTVAVNQELVARNILINMNPTLTRITVGTMPQNEQLIAALKEILHRD